MNAFQHITRMAYQARARHEHKRPLPVIEIVCGQEAWNELRACLEVLRAITIEGKSRENKLHGFKIWCDSAKADYSVYILVDGVEDEMETLDHSDSASEPAVSATKNEA